MKLQGSLACLLLVLCLGSGEAGPLLSGGESAGAGVMEATGHGVGEAVGQEVGETIKHGVGEATGRGDGEAAGSGVKEAMGPGVGDDLAHGVEDAAHALGNTGSEADRQAENVIQHGVHAAHSSRQGMPGGNGALGTHGQPPSGGHGTSGSPGNPGGPGIPWDHVYSGGSGGSFGTNPQGGSRGHGDHGGAFNVGTNTQAAVAQTPYGSGRGSDKPNAEGSSSGGSSNSSSGGSSGGSSGLHWKTLEILIKAATPSEVHVSGESGGQNSQTSPGLFNFDAFWMNLKFMLGFINWDAINKGQVSKPSTRILLYFRRLWENFKRNTPFLNWKAITEPGTGCQDVEAVTSKNDDYNQQTHPTATGGQHSAKIPTKGRLATALTPTAWGLPGGEWGVTISSSASRARPDLLQWVKFW
ncbi:dermokine isoform X3 [Balaenoptera musculus]|uniref:Dermokine isoform X3 n=1 Tax=Balaenoptera musculus TaxID=9771 RepID=A0A8B8VV76_BALMU|nr:dermokine isoform X3 [Balaenoptera musculus]